MAKITFKKHPRKTGLASVANPYQSIDLKFKKKVFGEISAPNYIRNGWRIRIAVKSTSIAGFTWEQYSKVCDTEEEARAFITERTEEILKRDLYFFED